VFLSDHPALEGGWHGAEHENGMAVRRWTDGNALLPMSGATSALMVDIQLDQATTYQLEAETRTPLRRAA
jgi:hypothetical protein